MISYFGFLDGQWFADDESGQRTYMTEAVWHDFIRLAGVPKPEPGQALPLRITERVTLQKFDGEITPESIPVETIILED